MELQIKVQNINAGTGQEIWICNKYGVGIGKNLKAQIIFWKPKLKENMKRPKTEIT